MSTDIDIIHYVMKLEEFFTNTHPNPRTRTIEDYLQAIAAVPPPLEGNLKSLPAAEMFRNDGNLMFFASNYKGAAMIYTGSLRAATPYSACSALVYANRSAALYHLGAFKECIADIDRALKLPYPENLKPKIIARKKAAIAKLNNDSNPAERRNSAPLDELKYTHGENAKLPGVSCGIEIARTPRHGRGLVAKKPFQPGDVLFAEKPYLAVPLFNISEVMDVDKALCNHCLKVSLGPIPCDRCCNIIYCSEECRIEAYQKYHRIECNVYRILFANTPFNIQALIVLLRCLNILTEQGANLEALCKDFEEIEKNSDSAQIIFTEEQFVENKGKVILDLKTNEPKQPSPSDLFDLAYMVVLLRNQTDFFKTDTDVLRLAKLLVKLNTICTQNSSQITILGKQELKGFGVFPLMSLANHACSTNTIAYIDKNERIVVRASRYIRPGDEILCNYHFSTVVINRIGETSRSIVHCQRYCRKCDDTFSFPIQRHNRIQIDKSLRKKLLKKPHDIESLWKVFKLLLVNEQQYSMQIQMIKLSLIEAYEVRIDHAHGVQMLQTLGIL